ncbi:hypothetical protein CSPX01_13644 [Colletotrichum filicis]|nr:hypothetical protein CSPX01_13644 [Colletotrichum filicis]
MGRMAIALAVSRASRVTLVVHCAEYLRPTQLSFKQPPWHRPAPDTVKELDLVCTVYWGVRPDFRKEAETTAYAAGSPQIIRGDSWNSPNGSGFPVQDLSSWLQAEAGRQIQKAVKAQIGRATITLIGPFILGVLLESV